MSGEPPGPDVRMPTDTPDRPERDEHVPSLARHPEEESLPKAEWARSLLRSLGLLEQAVGTALIGVLFVLVLIQVAQRYLPGGWAWTGEVARLALVWCTFSLAGFLMAQHRHITIQVIDLVLPRRALGVVKGLVDLIVAATCLGMAYASYRLIADDIGQRTPAAEIPLALVYVVPMIGFLLTALRAFLDIGLGAWPAMTGREAARPDEGPR